LLRRLVDGESPQPDSAAAPINTSVTQAEDLRGRRDMWAP
jgi:hypothetical protein